MKQSSLESFALRVTVNSWLTFHSLRLLIVNLNFPIILYQMPLFLLRVSPALLIFHLSAVHFKLHRREDSDCIGENNTVIDVFDSNLLFFLKTVRLYLA